MSDSLSKCLEVEKVASESCTRSGAFALLVSVVLGLLCVSWQQKTADEALAEYISARLNLAGRLGDLRRDKLWETYLLANPDAEKRPLQQVIHARFQSRPAQDKVDQVQPKDQLGPEPRTQAPVSPSTPSPPRGLSASFDLEPSEMLVIVESWRTLNDSTLLDKARETSNYFDNTIANWVNRRGMLLYANAVTGVCTVTGSIEIPAKPSQSNHVVRRITDEVLMNCITLEGLIELSQFEMPEMSNPLQIGGRVGRDIDLSPGSFPKDVYTASIVGEVLLFFVLAYFSAFAREAVSCESFPARGTLFGAFSNSRWMLIVLFLAVLTPCLACGLVAVFSGRIPVYALVLPVLLVTWSVHRSLAQKSFFSTINPFSYLAEPPKRLGRKR